MKYHGVDIPEKMIRDFCLRWKIREFSLFGSILRKDFQRDSDVDVLVEFKPDHGWSLYDIVDMEDELEAIVGRNLDLVMKGGLRNPIRRREILRNREVIYEA
jgi:predicted nucleotidyltransferase